MTENPDRPHSPVGQYYRGGLSAALADQFVGGDGDAIDFAPFGGRGKR